MQYTICLMCYKPHFNSTATKLCSMERNTGEVTTVFFKDPAPNAVRGMFFVMLWLKKLDYFLKKTHLKLLFFTLEF